MHCFYGSMILMIVSMLLILLLSGYCLFHGLVAAGLLLLLGMISGYGTLPLLAVSVMLVVEGELLAAVMPPLIIAVNFYMALKQQ